ncbi:hypothetical protein BJV82DRAFT_655680 [Fennellomyces sp. T-0311]|nr:hypothetical protein BJV82DRAFT_655680 [Fennellomyces sp. T-0311]
MLIPRASPSAQAASRIDEQYAIPMTQEYPILVVRSNQVVISCSFCCSTSCISASLGREALVTLVYLSVLQNHRIWSWALGKLNVHRPAEIPQDTFVRVSYMDELRSSFSRELQS